MVPINGLGDTPESQELLQYKRGSVILGAGIIGVALLVIVVSAGAQIASSSGANKWSEALTVLRLPSMTLPIALIVGEMSSGSAVGLLVYHPSSEYSHRGTAQTTTDTLLAITVFCSAWAVFLYCAYATTIGCLVETAPISDDDEDTESTSSQRQRWGSRADLEDDGEVELLSIPNLDENDDLNLNIQSNASSTRESGSDDDDTHSTHTTNEHRGSVLRRILKFTLEPTHGPVLPQHRQLQPSSSLEKSELWLRRHYFFVAERRWIPYGAIEVIAGSLVDVAEGIPVTSRTLAACAMPPIVMSVLLLGLLVTLIWKWPLAVRLQQWGALAINGLMFVAAVLVTVNVFVASVAIEEAASYFLMATSVLIAIFSVLDVLSWLLLIVPALRGLLGLRVTSLASTLARMRRDAHQHHHTNNTDPNVPRYNLAMLEIDDDGRVGNSGGMGGREEEIDFYRVAMEVLMHRLRQTSTSGNNCSVEGNV